MITFILVHPENPDNIGAAARAMKNMGFEDLRLVAPPKGWKIKAKKMAVAAADLLDRAKPYATLKEAIADCQRVIGTSRREGSRRAAFKGLEESLAETKTIAEKGRVAWVFGRESKGLANCDLKLCDCVVTIPASPVYPSLNLAQAVMVIAYSLSRILLNASRVSPGAVFRPDAELASKEETDRVLERIRETLLMLGYKRKGGELIGRILETFGRLFHRAGLSRSEAQMLKGYTRRILEKGPAK